MVRGSTVNTTKMPKNNCDIDLLIHNKFEIEVRSSETGEVKEKVEAYNIIKNDFWNYLFGGNDHRAWFQAIVFGNGSGTPSADTSGLFSFVGSKAASGNTFKTVPEEGYAYHRRSIQLGVSEFVGSTITEVGISSTSANQADHVFTHAMLQDMNGNQISITKTDTDIITIYATVYVHWNPAGYEDGRIKISYSGETNPRDGQLISELLGYLYQSTDTTRSAWFYSGPPSTLSIATASGNLVKNRSTKTYKLSFGRLGVDAGNVTSGILSAYAMNVYLQAPCSGLPGTNIQAEAVATGDGVTTEFNTKFPFPQNAEIFVDGVLATDVIVNGDNPGKTLPFTTLFKFLPEHSTISRGYLSIPMGIYDGQCGKHGGAGDGYVAVYENVWAHMGVHTILRAYPLDIELSDDLENWYKLTNTATGSNWPEYPVPEEYQYCRYWRLTNPYTWANGGYGDWGRACISVRTNTPTVNNIIFTTPPAEGTVITANYYTPVVAKDSDHVFDMSITIHLGEYTE